MKMKFIFIVLLGLSNLISPAWAAFQIVDIRVRGLVRIPTETVFDYLPVGVGDEVDVKQSSEIVKELFKTGFFRDIDLQQDGRVLIINVLEHPFIRKIQISGNRNLDDEIMNDLLKASELIEGRIFSEYSLKLFIEELKEIYIDRGNYGADISSAITPLENNLVNIDIEINEGPVARVQEIRFVGNISFDSDALRRESVFDGNIFTNWVSGKNKYSGKKLDQDLENLSYFYRERGFFEFEIQSKDVEISQDYKDVLLTITLSEGALYKFGAISVDDVGVLPISEIRDLITASQGSVFSRTAIINSRIAIQNALSNAGYAFAMVNPLPTIIREDNRVSFSFAIDLGPKTYVRRIDISGNSSTQEIVIRREMRQMEGAVYSREKIQRSQERIKRLGFFNDVLVEVEPVVESTDEVDLNFYVEEKKTGSLTFGIGYSEDERGFIQAEVSRNNLFGSGRQLEIALDRSKIKEVYELEYTNPYYTDNGISRGIFAKSKKLDGSTRASAGYIANSTGLGVRYRIPTSEYNAFDVSGEYENIELVSVDNTPAEYTSFINKHARNKGVIFKTTFSRDTRDQILFPKSGYVASVSAETSAPGSDLEYYKLLIRSQMHYSLTPNIVLGLNAGLGYGGGYGKMSGLPFYRNFFAGGASSVRGYRSRSLGPRSETQFAGVSLGGSRRFLGNANIYIPLPGLRNGDSTRLSIFIDSGQVYADGEPLSISALRFSAGVAFSWFTAIGPLALSYGVPLNEEESDRTKRFQISFGTMFP